LSNTVEAACAKTNFHCAKNADADMCSEDKTGMRSLFRPAAVCVLVIGAACAADPSTTVSGWNTDSRLPSDILTNEGLVVLSNAGFSDRFIVEKILLSRARFDTSAVGLAYLRRNAMSEELLQFVLEYATKAALPSSAAAPEAAAPVPVKIGKQKIKVAMMPGVTAAVMPGWPSADAATGSLFGAWSYWSYMYDWQYTIRGAPYIWGTRGWYGCSPYVFALAAVYPR
jgi:hypothetical protein